MGVYRSYSHPLLLASHQGKTFSKRQWSLVLLLSILMSMYVISSVLFTSAPSLRSRFEDVLFQEQAQKQDQATLTGTHMMSAKTGSHRAHAQHLHRTHSVVSSEERKMEEDRAAIVAEWQTKVNALREQIQVMQAKVEKEEALEADIWRLRKELKSIQQQRDPLMPANEATEPVDQHAIAASAAPSAVRAEGIHTMVMDELPSASAWCFGNERYDRLCRFKNLCYLPDREAFVLPKGNTTVLRNIPSDRQGALVDLTSLQDHSAFYFDYNEIDPAHPQFQHRKVRYIEKPTFLLSRFHPGNIMHTIHDDVIGLYHVLKEFAYHGEVGLGDPFALDHYIQFVDAHGGGEYAGIFQYLTSNPLLYHDSLHAEKDTITCYRDAVVGNSKQANWYQYGFSSPQGPIANKTVDGHQVREVADYIMRKAGFDLDDPFHLPPASSQFDPVKVNAHLAKAAALLPTADPRSEVISIFSRLRNRKLENEEAVAAALRATHLLPTVYVRMEELTFLEQVAILRRTRLALGMHGSILIMGMFLPRAASLMELYPYAVPSNNYTPYRHMARLPGMDLAYSAWENKHPQNTKSYPENHFMFGGLGHLSPDERKQVMNTPTVPKHTCCTNPYWLYRIFQDTTGHVQEIVDLSVSLFATGKQIAQQAINATEVEPSAIDADSIKCNFLPGNKLRLTWSAPWNGAKVQGYSIWDHNSFREYLTPEAALTLSIDPTKVTQVWIRPKKDDWRGKFTPRVKVLLYASYIWCSNGLLKLIFGHL